MRFPPIISALIIAASLSSAFIRQSPSSFLAGKSIIFRPHPTILFSSPFQSFLTLYMMARYPGRRVRRTSEFKRRIAQQAHRNRIAVTNAPTATVPLWPFFASLSALVHSSLLPLACRPLIPLTPSLCHTLRPLSDVICASCGALHWIEERASNTLKRDPLFSTYCEKGNSSLQPLLDPLESQYSFKPFSVIPDSI